MDSFSRGQYRAAASGLPLVGRNPGRLSRTKVLQDGCPVRGSGLAGSTSERWPSSDTRLLGVHPEQLGHIVVDIHSYSRQLEFLVAGMDTLPSSGLKKAVPAVEVEALVAL